MNFNEVVLSGDIMVVLECNTQEVRVTGDGTSLTVGDDVLPSQDIEGRSSASHMTCEIVVPVVLREAQMCGYCSCPLPPAPPPRLQGTAPQPGCRRGRSLWAAPQPDPRGSSLVHLEEK